LHRWAINGIIPLITDSEVTKEWAVPTLSSCKPAFLPAGEGDGMSRADSYAAKVTEWLEPRISPEGYELVDVEYVKEAGTYYLRVYIDKEGGVTVDDCETVSHMMDKWLDDEDFIPDAYILEVSSPGLGRPLKKEKDYIRNRGKSVEIHLYRAVDGEKEFEGILTDWDPETVTITAGDDGAVTFSRKDIALIRQAIDF
jgi:ribosome maturation factor RimP